VPFEYGRLFRLAVILLGVYFVGIAVPWGSLPSAIGGKLLLLAACPFLLYASGFFMSGETRRLWSGFGSLRRGPVALLQSMRVPK
jgi:hypothetical protein